MLTPGETIDDYREATAAEVQKYLTPPAVVRPEQWLIDAATIDGLTFNERTNFFSYNGLDDLTAEDYMCMRMAGRIKGSANAFYRGEKQIRTHLRFHEGLVVTGDSTFYACTSLETVKFQHLQPASYCFSNCTKLRSILGYSSSYGMNTQKCTSSTFEVCSALREVRLILNGGTVDLHWSPNIDLDSWRGMIAHAANTQPQTVIVHPAIYAKMTDDTIPVPGTDSTDWTDYRPNLLLDSDVAVENSDYPIALWKAGSLIPPAGKPVTVTVWGVEMGDGKTGFSVLGSTGYNTCCGFSRGNIDEAGFGSKTGIWPRMKDDKSENGIGIWPTPQSVTAISRIERIKLTLGDDPNPQWTMCSDEIEDAELRERTQWRELLFMAAARQITFATVES